MASSVKKQALQRARLCEILNGSEVTGADFADPDLMLAAAQEGVMGLLLADLKEAGEAVVPQADARREIAAELRRAFAEYVRLHHACARILSALNEAEIPVICMRGLAVSERYYGERAYLRPISDIDLLLDQRRMLDAKQVLWDIGFRPDAVYRNIYSRGNIAIDLHHEPLGFERIDAWRHITSLRTPEFFEYAQSGELLQEPALLLPPEVELPYLCFHALKHSCERLIWLYDIALLAHRIEEADGWEPVLASILKYGLERPCFYVLSYAKAYLGAPVPDTVLIGIKPAMGRIESNLFMRHMQHEIIPYLAERLFARMQPDWRHRLAFWRETIYPREEVRQQVASGGCVKCNFIRQRLKQLFKALWLLVREAF